MSGEFKKRKRWGAAIGLGLIAAIAGFVTFVSLSKNSSLPPFVCRFSAMAVWLLGLSLTKKSL